MRIEGPTSSVDETVRAGHLVRNVRVWSAATVLLLGGGLLGGCASSAPTVTVAPDSLALEEALPVADPLIVPAGVDSSIALLVDSLAAVSYVTLERQSEATSLLEEGLRLRDESDDHWQPFVDLKPDSAGAARQSELLEGTRQALGAALEANPFHPTVSRELARVRLRQVRRVGMDSLVTSAASFMEAAFERDRSAWFVLEEWAHLYFGVGRYAEAVDRFVAAEQLMRDVHASGLQDSFSTADSLDLFAYVSHQGHALLGLGAPAEARKAFERAELLARSEDDARAMRQWITFIDWDGGNVSNREARDSILAFVAAEDWEAAALGFAELLPALQTPGAQDEIAWRLALVEVQLDRREEAASRLRWVVERAYLDLAPGVPRDSLRWAYLDSTSGALRDSLQGAYPDLAPGVPRDSLRWAYLDSTSGALRDSLREIYLEDYGALCFNLGQIAQEEHERHSALKYYLQAAEMPWSNRSKAYLGVVSILENNIPEAIRYAERGLEVAPPEEDERALRRWLVELYRRAGQMEEAYETRRILTALDGSLEEAGS